MKNDTGKRFVLGILFVLLLGGCAHEGVEWEHRSLPPSPYVAGNDYMEIAYPRAVGGAAADSVNRAIETYLHSVFGMGGAADSVTLTEAVDSLLVLRRRDSLYGSSSPYDLRATGWVRTCGRVASVRLQTYVLTGGAQGDLRVKIMNFDLRNGRRLEAADLFVDTVRMRALNRIAFEKMLFDKGLSGDVLLVAFAPEYRHRQLRRHDALRSVPHRAVCVRRYGIPHPLRRGRAAAPTHRPPVGPGGGNGMNEKFNRYLR